MSERIYKYQIVLLANILILVPKQFMTGSPMQPVRRTRITRRVLDEVQLVVVLRISPFPSLNDLSNDLCIVGVKVFLLHLLGHLLGSILLGGGVIEDGRTIL